MNGVNLAKQGTNLFQLLYHALAWNILLQVLTQSKSVVWRNRSSAIIT